MSDQETDAAPAAFMQKLLLSSKDLTEFLADTATAAANFVADHRGRAWCAITLLRHNRPITVATSHAYAERLDETQAGFEEGPCLSSVREHRTELVPDTRSEERWSQYCRAAAEEGVLSILAVPFQLGDQAQAVLNVYFEHPDRFDAVSVRRVEEYVGIASTALRLAVRLAEQQDSQTNLQAALASRTDIDVAVGIIMSQNHCTQEVAFGILRKASNNRNVKLRDLAAQLVATVGKGSVTRPPSAGRN